jgi:hypothetical protein
MNQLLKIPFIILQKIQRQFFSLVTRTDADSK